MIYLKLVPSFELRTWIGLYITEEVSGGNTTFGSRVNYRTPRITMQTSDRWVVNKLAQDMTIFTRDFLQTTLFIINAHFDNSNGLVSIVIATKQTDLIRIQFQT